MSIHWNKAWRMWRVYRKINDRVIQWYYPLECMYEAMDIDLALALQAQETDGTKASFIKIDGSIWGLLIKEVHDTKDYHYLTFHLRTKDVNGKIRHKWASIHYHGFDKAFNIVVFAFCAFKGVTNLAEMQRFIKTKTIYKKKWMKQEAFFNV